MGLQPCRECGHDTSTEAAACPKCGAPNPTGVGPSKQRQDTSGKTDTATVTKGVFAGMAGCALAPFIIGFVLLLLLIILASLFGG